MLNFRFGSLQILAFLEALSFDHGSLMVPLLRLARFSEYAMLGSWNHTCLDASDESRGPCVIADISMFACLCIFQISMHV